MDVSTAMENNTAECENEELVLEKATKRKIGSGSVKATIKNDAKRKIVSGSVNDKKQKISTSGLRRCPQCRREFWNYQDLEEHITTNCAFCSECGESFSSYPTLYRHICNAHSDEKDLGYETKEEVTTVENKKR